MGMSIGQTGGRGSRGHRRRGRHHGLMAEINVTPFVDVMLVLLIIFMVTAPMLTAGVPVDLPDSRANALPQEQQEVTVSITGDGTIYLDDSALAPGELPDRLATAGCAAGEGRQVTLRADRTLDYGRVMSVMGELNRAGCNQIALVTHGSVSAP